MRFVIFCFFFKCLVLLATPQAVYLTLPEDPAHSISIHWIEKLQKGIFDVLLYQKEGDIKWTEVSVNSCELLGGSTYFIKKCLVKDLEESTYYHFYFKGDEEKFLFRTLPSSFKRQIKIAIGGDFTESISRFRKMNKVASSKNPDFAILAGDIAYSCGHGFSVGKHGSVARWVRFFQLWQKTMRGERDMLIPVVGVVGNHDVTSTDRREEGKDAFILKFFPEINGLSYKSLNIAGALSLLLLDSGHLFPIQTDQTRWLEKTLKAQKDLRWKIPVYHLAGYPSVHSPDSHLSSRVRKYWVPIFEKYGVKLVFEHHNHSFKRTYPLLKEKIDLSGIVYIGDGGWGALPRKKKNEQFYLEKSEASNNFSLLSVDQDSLKVEVFNAKNKIIDSWEYKPSI